MPTEKNDYNIEEELEEFKTEIKKLIKNRSILDSQRIGKKIDSFIEDEFNKYLRDNEDFFKSLKGNSHPGINERFRNMEKSIGWVWKIIIFIVVVDLFGGSVYNISKEKIKEQLGIGKDVKIEKVEDKKIDDKNVKIEEKDFIN